MKPESGSFQAADTPIKSMDCLGKCYFENTCPIQKTMVGHQSNKKFSSLHAHIIFTSGAQHDTSTSKYMSYLLKEVLFLKM